jgi:hypothetical protein
MDNAQRIADIRKLQIWRIAYAEKFTMNALHAACADIDFLLAELDRQGREIERLQAIEQAWHERFD